ncbi:MAG: cutinase family protein [Candidatus Nomurabacteria bacterium]|jgi:hypothetical protein|nr:cutinase family protein [Candidatus Nomurabacteria bacterium]
MLVKKNNRRASILALAICATLCSLASAIFLASNDTLAASCNNIEFIFARGSGQGLNDDKSEFLEFQKIIGSIKSKAPTLTTNLYQLGTTAYDGHTYPAVVITTTTGIGAYVSAGQANKYGASVTEGVLELMAYLKAGASCKDTRYVLAGYSQGAQVMGEALGLIDRSTVLGNIKDRIVYVALFGDPKLYLPEGEGFNPPACRGTWRSEWNVYVPNCDTDNGSLGARNPYVPSAWGSKVGLWCNDHDFICGSSKFLSDMDGHGKYKASLGIPYALNIITVRLMDVFPSQFGIKPGGEAPSPEKPKIPKMDTVILIDATGSMFPYIDAFKQEAIRLANITYDAGGRVALAIYRDTEIDPRDEVSIFCPLSTCTKAAFLQMLNNGIDARGGGDDPEALLHALMTVYNESDWAVGAQKSVIVLTDDSYHDPDRIDGSTLADVVKRSLEIDPVNTYVISVEHMRSEYEDLVNLTGGKFFTIGDMTGEDLEHITDYITTRPMAVLDSSAYTGKANQDIVFDATGSYGVGADIVRYEWDLDFDQTFETVTTAPFAVKRYDSTTSGMMQLKVIDKNGSESTMSATVTISGESAPSLNVLPPTILSAERSLTGSAMTLKVRWANNDTNAKYVMVSVDGVLLGYADASQLNIGITDLNPLQDVTIGLQGMTEAGEVGAGNYLVIAKGEVDEKEDAKAPQTNTPTVPTPSAPAQTTLASSSVLEDALAIDTPSNQISVAQDTASTTEPVSDKSGNSQGGNQQVYFIIAVAFLALVGVVSAVRSHVKNRRLK